MIVEIKAKFSCDDCGTEFFVGIDPAYLPPPDWSAFDIAEDAIRKGGSYEDATDSVEVGYGSVCSEGRHYCMRCTDKHDKEDHGQEG